MDTEKNNSENPRRTERPVPRSQDIKEAAENTGLGWKNAGQVKNSPSQKKREGEGKEEVGKKANKQKATTRSHRTRTQNQKRIWDEKQKPQAEIKPSRGADVFQ